MTLSEILNAMKSLRDAINDHPMPVDDSGDWVKVHGVLYKLNEAIDILEFPTDTQRKRGK